MKNITTKFTAILMIFGAFAVVSFGQKTERVKFVKGETNGTFTRTLPANGSMDFIINAKTGQYMDYNVAYDFKKTDIGAFLSEPNLQDVSQTPAIDQRNVFAVNTSGDHRLTVNNMTSKRVTFTLYISIFDSDPDVDEGDGMSAGGAGGDDVERIELARNTVFTDIEMTLDPGETRQFVAYVKKGFMVCIESNKKLGSNVKVGVDAKTLSMSNTSNCTAKAIESRDQYIYFENSGRNKISFTATVGFYNN